MISSAKQRKELPLTDLHIATILGNLDTVKKLVENGSNPLDTDINGDTLLHFAAFWGKLDVLKYLIEEIECNPATKGWNGSTILHAAVRRDNLPVIKYLVEDCKVDGTTEDNEGCTAFDLACKYRKIEVVQTLEKSLWNGCVHMMAFLPTLSNLSLYIYNGLYVRPVVVVV